MEKYIRNNKIGVCDSGVGGLSVLNELVKELPNENFLYFGDTKNLPYGSKSDDELIFLAKKVFDYFAKQNVKSLVIACNTTSAKAYDILKDKYNFKIYPLIQSVATSFKNETAKKIGVFSTVATANSHAYKKALENINPKFEIFEIGCDGWVQIVEKGLYNEKSSKELIKKYSKYLVDKKAEKIILGCTHYPYLTELLSTYFAPEILINPAKPFAKFISEDLKKLDLISTRNQGNQEFAVNEDPENFSKRGNLFFNIKNSPKLIQI